MSSLHFEYRRINQNQNQNQNRVYHHVSKQDSLYQEFDWVIWCKHKTSNASTINCRVTGGTVAIVQVEIDSGNSQQEDHDCKVRVSVK